MPVGTIPQLADYLVNGYWQDNHTNAHHWAAHSITVNIDDLNGQEQFLARAALTAWSEVANISFVETHGAANITYNNNGSGLIASTNAGWTGSGNMTGATVDISSQWVAQDGGFRDGRSGIDSYAYQTYLHETGHALGLGHQGPYNGNATYGSDNVYDNDTWQFSLMSYFEQDHYDGGSFRYAVTPQMADIYAIQSIYGAAGARADNTTYGFHSTAGSIYDFAAYGQAPALTLYDSGGTDTLDCSGYAQNQTIDLNAGAFCSVGGLVHNIGIALNTVVENAIGGTSGDYMLGNQADNVLSGGGGTDTLAGGLGNDTLIGGVGNDLLQGGGGTDVAAYAVAAASASWSQNADGSWTVTSADGTDTLIGIEYLEFNGVRTALGNSSPPPGAAQSPTGISSGDFNGDGKGEILALYGNGAVATWQLNGDQVAGHQVLPTVGSDWHLAGIGDVNGDGRDDILWRHDSGQLVAWELNGGQISGYDNFGQVGLDWHLAGIGDINGDGRDDILWRHDSGELVAWELNGGRLSGYDDFGRVSTDWHLAATGDMNGDGRSDILWRHDTGELVGWELNGGSLSGYDNFGRVGTDWDLAGTGDINGDGRSDILWRHDTGQLVGWELNGGSLSGYDNFGQIGPEWQLARSQDFNGDHRSDVLWRHDSGALAEWELNGGQLIGYHSYALHAFDL